MSIQAVILDAVHPFEEKGAWPPSWLGLPHGQGTLFEAYEDALGAAGVRIAGVLPLGNLLQDYARSLGHGARILERDLPNDAVSARRLLLIDGSWCDPDILSAGLLRRLTYAARRTRHLVLQPSEPSVREQIADESPQQITGVTREYATTDTHPASRHIATLITDHIDVIAALRHVDRFEDVRTALVAHGTNGDVDAEGDVYVHPVERVLNTGLTHYLSNIGRTLARSSDGDTPAAGRHAGTGSVDPAAKLAGPVAVQEGGVVSADAVVVGPAIIGRCATVGRGAVVTNSVVGPNAGVEEGAALHDALALRVAPSNEISNLPAAEPRRTQPRPPTSVTSSGVRGGRGGGLSLKRGLDCLLAGAALLALSPLLGLVAAMVALSSRGPVFYGDEREGRDGQKFRCWKFRTMVANAAELQKQMRADNGVDGPQFKLRRDPRITSVGRVLRATNIDELPQLFNVIRGEMSLVGPRPSPFRENQVCVSWRHARLRERPGITGLWQVCRREREYSDFHQWIQYDLLYSKHASTWLDLKILLATVVSLGGRRGVPADWLIHSRRQIAARRSSSDTVEPIPILAGDADEGLHTQSTRTLLMPHRSAPPLTAHAGEERDFTAVHQLLPVVQSLLQRMYVPQAQRFAHSLRKDGGGVTLCGTSSRYTAIVLIGLQDADATLSESILPTETLREVADSLASETESSTSLGDAALTLWCLTSSNHDAAPKVARRVAALIEQQPRPLTVEAAWALRGLCGIEKQSPSITQLCRKLAERLVAAIREDTGIVPWRLGAGHGLRDHVASFADQVYPIQALAHYHMCFDSPAALSAAKRVAAQICELQGSDGQWWWHYDARTSAIVEEYPVYAVHQDAMAPMALHALREAGGPSYEHEIMRGLQWMSAAPELDGASLIDHEAEIIWRKVDRGDPRKLIRTLNAATTRLRRGARLTSLARLYRPRVDYECRPYHLGWLLHAWRHVLSSQSAPEIGVA